MQRYENILNNEVLKWMDCRLQIVEFRVRQPVNVKVKVKVEECRRRVRL